MPSNPLLQVVYFLVGGVVLIGALVMGAVVLSLVFGLALIAGVVIWIRIWWIRRKILKAAARTGADRGAEGATGASAGRVIEVEYTVVDERPNPRDRAGRDRRD
jgi:small-conductance mechanosensitive channel